MQIDPIQLGTLEIEHDVWIPYIDLYDAEFLPTRIKVANDEYAFQRSAPVLGYGAFLPADIRAARSAGKKPIIVEREDRYYLFLTPP
ncbi:MAG: hypothetical protein WEB52_15340 [Dehalococcoidia bacterium]